MKIITMLSQKGGTGKTTLTASLAVECERHNQQALVVDVDPQSSIYKWSQRREVETPFVESVQAAALHPLLQRAEEAGADIALIDTPGTGANSTAVHAAKVADLVIIPCRPSAHDIDAIDDSIQTALLANKQPYVLLNAVPPNADKMFIELRNVIQDNYRAKVIPFYIANRSAYMHSALEGLAAQEFDEEGKAAEEVRRLYMWIKTMID